MAVLLRNFDALLQRLSGSTAAYASRTAQQHLRCVARALELLPELQELAGGEQQLQQLLVQVKAAVVEVKVGSQRSIEQEVCHRPACFDLQLLA